MSTEVVTAEAPAVVDANTVASAEVDGRILSGVGVTAESLAKTMENRPPLEDRREDVAPIEAPKTNEPERLTRGRKRYFELSREAKEAATRAETAERERDELRARLAQPTVVQPQQQQAAAPVQPPPIQQVQQSFQPATGRPQPKEDEIGTKYASYADFVLDSALWVNEKSSSDIQAQIRASIEADRASRSFLETVERTRAKGRANYKDFDAVLTSGTGSQVPLGRTPQESMDRASYVIHHPQSEHLQYAIMRDGAVAQRLAAMSDIDFGIELAKLAPATTAVTPASTVTPGTTTAPAPYQPVGSGTRTTAPTDQELAQSGVVDYDKSGWREKRAAERKARSGR